MWSLGFKGKGHERRIVEMGIQLDMEYCLAWYADEWGEMSIGDLGLRIRISEWARWGGKLRGLGHS